MIRPEKEGEPAKSSPCLFMGAVPKFKVGFGGKVMGAAKANAGKKDAENMRAAKK